MSKYRQPYTLFKRGKYWYFRTYSLDGVRTTAKTTGQTSKSAAKDYCDKLYLSGNLATSNITFKDYAAHFYDDNSPYCKDRVTPLAENTLRGLRVKMRNYIMPYFSNVKIADITYTKLKEFRIWMLNDKGYSVSNTVGTMSCLKHIIDSAHRDRLIPVNPFDYLETITAPQDVRDAFRLNEVIKLYSEIGEEFRNTVLLIALTGMRISEAVGVTEDFVQQAEKCEYIYLDKQYNLKKYKPLKGRKIRSIPIIPEIKELFGFDDTQLSKFYKVFNKIKPSFENAYERELCFHSLRHFFFTSIITEGIPEVKAKYLVGHSLKGMNNVYLNLKPDDLIEILDWQKRTLNEIKSGAAEYIRNTTK